MTIEDRAHELITKFFSLPAPGIRDRQIIAPLIMEALRDQIEDCASVIDSKIEDWKHSMKTIKHFTGTYEEVELMEEMADAIRALAGSTTTEEGKENER